MITTKKNLLAIALVSALGLNAAPIAYAQNGGEEKTEPNTREVDSDIISEKIDLTRFFMPDS
jgi:hypothetical protein